MQGGTCCAYTTLQGLHRPRTWHDHLRELVLDPINADHEDSINAKESYKHSMHCRFWALNMLNCQCLQGLLFAAVSDSTPAIAAINYNYDDYGNDNITDNDNNNNSYDVTASAFSSQSATLHHSLQHVSVLQASYCQQARHATMHASQELIHSTGCLHIETWVFSSRNGQELPWPRWVISRDQIIPSIVPYLVACHL